MSRGGAMPITSPMAWTYLRSGNCTIRWQRGDNVAYILPGKQMDAYPDKRRREGVLATIHVPPNGWTDLAQVRLTAENWVKANRQRCQACGVDS